MKATIGTVALTLLPLAAAAQKTPLTPSRIDMFALAMEQMEGQIMELARAQAPNKP